MFQSLRDRLQLQQILGVSVHTGTTGAVYPLLMAALAALRSSVVCIGNTHRDGRESAI